MIELVIVSIISMFLFYIHLRKVIENYDEIYIFGLETGRWDLLTEYFKNKDIMLPNEKIKYAHVDNFGNINELNQKIGNEIKIKKQEIIEIDMDITHSFRNIPFNLLTSLRLFELLNDNIVLRSIYYGERILNSEYGSIYKIPILEIINLYKSIVEFKDYTKYTNFLENTKMIDEKLLKIKGIYVLNSKVVKDISEYLSCFDLLITDYSSIFIDYLLLDKPILFLPYDFEKYNNEIGFTVNYMTHTPGPKSYSFENFKNEIMKLLNDNEYFFKDRINDKVFYNLYTDNKNCERVSKFILENL